MLKLCQSWSIFIGIFIGTSLVICASSEASELSVTLEVQPPDTTISVDSLPVAIAAQAQGTELQFAWQIVGQGTLEGDTAGFSVLYVPPEKISRASTRAIVTVKVTDYKSREATESVMFTITQDDDPSSPPSTPEPTSTPHDDLISMCDYRMKIQPGAFFSLIEKNTQNAWVIEGHKSCGSGRWKIMTWEVIDSQAFCRHIIFPFDEEEAKGRMQDGNLFSSEGIIFNPQDIVWYPEGKQNRCQIKDDTAWTIGVMSAHTSSGN